ncbi:hypothetical protein [Ancylobacter mangrovi]|uniref:hypothetical protein n=1 Tax=Ancylobacter mangrovi TaxID=2972472 RepID=UPI0021619769|nr:hypothetical protein [Ancylobacter mangrovi]MCS0502302.1 hypothetical protein [Ancylobacter mangrovi]
MPLVHQMKAIQLIEAATGQQLLKATPPWLLRPGAQECAGRWYLLCDIYRALTGLNLPEQMPRRESRRIDAILPEQAGPRVVEIDEGQHFNLHRKLTLDTYPADVPLAFDRNVWCVRSNREPRPRSGGWAAPKPPLFPGSGGRHLQRAFRDALADILPPLHGYAPTLRIADFEVAFCGAAVNPVAAMRELLVAKGVL